MFLGEIPRTSTDSRAHRVLTALHMAEFATSELPSTAGELLGLLVGAKPAVLFLSEEPDACAAWARAIAPLGFDMIVDGQMIADPRQLVARAEQESAFSARIGWDVQRTTRENIRWILAKNAVNATLDASDGFLLGYPECGVRQMEHYYNLARRGLVWIHTLDETEIPPEDREIHRALSDRLIQAAASAIDSDRMLTEIYASDECHGFFHRFFPQATEEDYAILANGRGCFISGPWGTEVYSFAINAADVGGAEHRALQAHVRDGFARHGFAPFL